jgi:hypothetical protein
MDSRNFDVNPSLVGSDFPEIVGFMASKEFRTAPIGQKINQLEQLSNLRRLKFQRLYKSMPASEKPPQNYVAKDVCPFECCRYGDWTVLDDTRLVNRPGSAIAVGTVRKGGRVLALSGEVHLTPEPVIVLSGDNLPKNTIAFVLDAEGEGYGHVYTRGKVVSTFLGYSEYCFRPSEYCWGEDLFPSAKERQQVWWVKVRIAGGIEGWTDKTENFGKKDSCS